MKKIIIILIAVFLFTGCSNNSSNDKKETSKKDNTTTYTFNKYSLSNLYKTKLSSDQKQLYKDMVDALYSHSSSINTTFTEEEYDKFQYAFYNNCPLAAYLTNYDITCTNNKINFKYTCNKEEADKIIKDFKAKVTSIIKENVKDTSTKNKVIRSLYVYLSKTTEYNSNEETNDLGIKSAHFAYDVIMKKKGFCSTITDAYGYLLSQVDDNIKFLPVRDTEGSHKWSMIQMDNGKYYHFDPTFQTSFLDGKIDEYYGMSDDIRHMTLEGEYILANDMFPDYKLPKCNDNISSNIDNPDDGLIGD